jgi:hypothetical protein
LGLSTVHGDIHHSQRLQAVRIVGSWYESGYLALVYPETVSISRAAVAREMGSLADPRNIISMLYKTLSAAVYGIDANIIQVEVDCSGIKCDQDHFHTVGLPDAAVRESRDRVRAALKNCGYDIPPTQITIDLAPADIKKEGSGFDLPMALGIVGAYGGLTKKDIPDCLFVGALARWRRSRSPRSLAKCHRSSRPQDFSHGSAGSEREGSVNGRQR